MKRKISIIIIGFALCIFIGLLFYSVVETGAFTANVSQKNAEELNTGDISSDKYLISEKYSYIGRIPPKTRISAFKEEFKNIQSNNIHVYKADNLEEVQDGYIVTNMIVKFDTSDKKYTALVVGDINGDGVLNQIDLKFVIGHIVGIKKYKLEDKNLIVADINNDGDVNQLDLKSYVDYILYERLNIPKFIKSMKPKIEIIGEEISETKWYKTHPTVKISKGRFTNDEELVYKIQGITEDGKEIITDEIEVHENEITMQLKKDGEYTLTAYTYSKEGARSDKAVAELKLDTTAPRIDAFKESAYGLTSLDIYISAKDTLSGVSKYKIKYGKESTNLNKEITKTVNGEKEYKENVKIENIEKDTKYYFKLEIEDRVGIKVESDVIEIWSTPSKPTIIIENKDNWTQNKNITIAAREGYEIWYTTDGINPKTSANAIKVNTNEKAIFTVNNECEIKAIYVNTNDKNKTSEVETARAEKIDTQKPIITKFEKKAGTKVTADSVTVEAAATDGNGCGVMAFVFRYKTATSNWIWSKTYTAVGNSVEHTFTELEPGTEYQFEVQAWDWAENWSNNTSVTETTMYADPTISITNEDEWQTAKTVTVTFPTEQTDTNKYYIRCKFADHDTYIVRRWKFY